MIDITVLKQEKALKASEIRYRRLFEAARDGILILDADTGQVIDANPFLVEMLGFPHKECLGKKIWELGSLKDIIANKDAFNKLQKKGYVRYEGLLLETSAGQRLEVEFVSSVYEVDHQEVIQCNIRDITKRSRLEKERNKFIDELKQKNAELESFTYAVSHDLKSPLVTIKAFAGYLKKDMSGSDAGRVEQDMLYINGAADKMVKLLDELLELLRIGRITNPAVTVTFNQLVQETLNLVAGRIEKRGVKVQVSAGPITLHGDQPRLVEIWQNLVDNAVKFMGDQPAPRIDIGAEQRDGEAVFFVRDNGMGIDPQYHSKLFNLFEKIEPKSEGTGMGLTITKRIVELYKGTIWLESEGQGQGTCFRFTLPVALNNTPNGK